jgi:hypothetical protein
MSIWCSRPHIGFDTFWEPNRKRPTSGQVRSYANGWSNHYPTTDGTVEQPAMVDTAHIAPWCVPGNETFDVGPDGKCGPWLRLGVHTVEHSYPSGGQFDADGKRVEAYVVLNENAVRALVADLQEWLDTPKARPKKPKP